MTGSSVVVCCRGNDYQGGAPAWPVSDSVLSYQTTVKKLNSSETQNTPTDKNTLTHTLAVMHTHTNTGMISHTHTHTHTQRLTYGKAQK